MSDLIVAMDGPAGVGKSTLAKMLAKALGVPVLDTGAMYRAVAWLALERGIDPRDGAAVGEIARQVDLEFRLAPGSETAELWVDGKLAGRAIRTPEVSEAASVVSTHPAVRQRMVELQRQMADRSGAVVEGRDIGTVVFPQTPHKFFLKARPEVRAERRWKELVAAGKTATLAEVLEDIRERDERDSTRELSPLRCDASYREVDTSDLEPAAIVELLVAAIRSPRP